MPRNRAVAVVIHEDKLLVMFRKNSEEYFTFPGGGIEENETEEQATHRELYEETSIKIDIDRLIYKLDYDNGDTHYYFLSRYLSGEPRVQAGTNEYNDNQLGNDTYKPMWLPVKELPSTTLYPLKVRDRLIDDLSHGFSQNVVQFDLTAIF